MPSTTNALESTHGHLNAKLPRRNEFCPSLYRLVTSITSKDLNFSQRCRANYNRIKRLTFRRVNEVNHGTLEEECTFFKTTVNTCECAETVLESSMLRLDLPCSHRIFKGATYPDFPDISLSMKMETSCSKCEKKLTVINIEVNPVEHEDVNELKKDAVRNIIKFGKTKKETAEKFVDENLHVGEDAYVMGRPLSYYSLIHKGIMKFRNIE